MGEINRPLIAATAFTHGLVHAYILLIPVFVPVWLVLFHVDPFVLGLVAALAYALYGLGSLPFGLLADRSPAVPLLILSLVGMGVSLLLASLAPALSIVALALASLGASASIYHPTGLALISRRFARQGQALGWHGVGGSLGVALGPLAASLLLLRLPPSYVIALLSSPVVLGILLLLIADPREAPPSANHEAAAPLALLRDPSFLLILLVYMGAGAAYWGALTFLPVFLDSEGTLGSLEVAGLSLAPSKVLFPTLLAMGAGGQLLSGHLSDRSRPELSLTLLSWGEAATLAVLVVVRAWALVPVALALGFLLFALEPLQNILIVQRVPSSRRGLAYGLAFLSVFGIGGIIGAPLAGYLATAVGYPAIFPAMAPFMALSGLASFALLRRGSAARGAGRDPQKAFRPAGPPHEGGGAGDGGPDRGR